MLKSVRAVELVPVQDVFLDDLGDLTGLALSGQGAPSRRSSREVWPRGAVLRTARSYALHSLPSSTPVGPSLGEPGLARAARNCAVDQPS